MTRSSYGGAGNSSYPHSHDSGSGYTRGGGLLGLFGCLLLLIKWPVRIALFACLALTFGRAYGFVASSLAGVL